MDNLDSKQNKDTQGGRIIELILKTIGIFAGVVALWWLFGLVVMVGNFWGYIPGSFYNTVEPYFFFF